MHEILIIAILILVNGLLSMAEMALISVKKINLANDDKRSDNGSKSAKIALKLANNPNLFLSTVQIGITLVGILTGIYSGSLLADQFSAVIVQWGVASEYSYIIAQTTIVVIVTYLTLIFGELVPKRIGLSMSEKVAKIVARPMYLFSIVAKPLVWLLSKSTSLVYKLLGIKHDEGKVTEDEIKSMIEEGMKDGEVQEVEQDIVERVFMLGDLKISSLMTHKSDIVALDVNMSKKELKETIQENLYQLYPVIDKSFDNVKGVVTIKDLLFKFDKDDFDLNELIKQVTFFHDNMSVYNALEHMKRERISQALICDEFGSCMGIITLKDILEGLVGAIDDTHSEPDIIKRNANSWLIDGQCSFYDFITYFDVEPNDDEGDYNTVSGLILENLKHIPISGESIEWNNLKLEVVDMDGVRIDKILITTIEPLSEQNNGNK